MGTLRQGARDWISLHKAITGELANENSISVTDCAINLPLTEPKGRSDLSSIWSNNHANAFGPSVMHVPKCTGKHKPSYWLAAVAQLTAENSLRDFSHLMLLSNAVLVHCCIAQ